MNPKKNRQTLHTILSTVFVISAIILILAGSLIKDAADQLVMATEGIEGSRIANPIDLGEIKKVELSEIKWTADTSPEGTWVTIEVAVTSSGTEIPEIWIEASNEESIPGIAQGDDLSGKFIWVKQTLGSSDPAVTPRLISLTETIEGLGETEGERISSEFDILKQGNVVKDSRIFWETTDEGFGGRIEVEVSVNNGPWQEAINGASIPGLKDLTYARIKTKTSFFGGPHLHPALENINLFVETE